MIIVGTELIDEFCKHRERARRAFDKWLPKVESAEWKKRIDAKTTFPATDPWTSDNGTEYLIFDVGGNKYRVVARPIFITELIIIMVVMTHDEYLDRKSTR